MTSTHLVIPDQHTLSEIHLEKLRRTVDGYGFDLETEARGDSVLCAVTRTFPSGQKRSFAFYVPDDKDTARIILKGVNKRLAKLKAEVE